MRVIGAEAAGLDPGGEVVAEGGVGFCDFVDGLFDALGDGAAGALGVGGTFAVAASEADGGGELMGDRIHFLLNFDGSLRIVPLLGFMEFFAQFRETLPVLRFGFGIEHRAAVVKSGDD